MEESKEDRETKEKSTENVNKRWKGKDIENSSEIALGDLALAATDIQEIVEILIFNPNLQTLSLGHNQIEDEGMQYISHLLTNGKSSILSVGLSLNGIGEQGTKLLTEALQATPVTELLYGSNKCGDKGALYFGQLFKSNSDLRKLHLYENGITDIGCSYMVDGLLKNTTLVEFDIGDNSIGNNGVIIIGNLLRRNSTLVKLWIGANKIDTIEELATALTVNYCLQYLDLSWNKIDSKGAQQLAIALESNDSLNTLEMVYCCRLESDRRGRKAGHRSTDSS